MGKIKHYYQLWMDCTKLWGCLILILNPYLQVYRLEAAGDDPRTRPIVASLTNQADKWEILCLARSFLRLIPCRVILEVLFQGHQDGEDNDN